MMWVRQSAALLLVILSVGCGGTDSSDQPETGSDSTSKPPAAGGYTVIDVANGGSVAGRVRMKGNVELQTFQSPATQDVCGDVRRNNRLEPGPDGGVRWAIVYLRDIRSGRAFPETATASISLDQKQCQYLPHLIAVRKGASVAIRNLDPVPHNVRIEDVASDSILLNIVQATSGRADD